MTSIERILTDPIFQAFADPDFDWNLYEELKEQYLQLRKATLIHYLTV